MLTEVDVIDNGGISATEAALFSRSPATQVPTHTLHIVVSQERTMKLVDLSVEGLCYLIALVAPGFLSRCLPGNAQNMPFFVAL